MVRLTRIYTKGGDAGETSLGDGARVPKHDARVAAYGTVDEANAAIGLARLHLGQSEVGRDADGILGRVQNDLFDLGADLCRPPRDASGTADKPAALRVTAGQVTRLEQEIDRLNADLAPLTSFVLPGGTAGAAHLHLARTVTRRAEREMTALAQCQDVNPEAIRYINRLSDLLFVLSRVLNDCGAQDVLWEPGQNT